MTRNFGYNLFRQIIMFIDWAIYNLIAILNQAIFDIADLPEEFYKSFYNDIVKRIYIILAIFMLFKVTVSLLTYLVNPDTISDKQQGAGKLVTRIMTTMIMLLLAPTIFTKAAELQKPILKTLPKIILARTTYQGDENLLASDTSLADDGTQTAWTVLTAFFNRNPDCVSNAALANSEPDYKTWIENNYDNYNDTLPSNILRMSLDHINDACGSKDNSVYAYEYTPILSTIAGGFLCYCLIGIAISIAVRMFKVLILQIIAPIPIISYIDPKANKDGAFNQWVKTYITTWLDLFINIAIVYLIIYFVSNIIIGTSGTEFINYVKSLGGRRGTFFMVFVILGLFAFARQAPKFITDALGIKNKGTFGNILGMSAAVIRTPGTIVNETREEYARRQAGGYATNRPLNLASGIVQGLGATAMAVGEGYNADKNSRTAVLNNLDKRRQDLLNRDKRMATVMKDYEDYVTDRFQVKGADVVVRGVGGMSSVTLNEFDQARQLAAASHNATFTIGGRTFRTYGGEVEAARGDIIDAGTEAWASGNARDRNGNLVTPNPEERNAIEDYRHSIRQTGGRTGRRRDGRNVYSGYDTRNYKGRRKPTERHVTIETNSRQNRNSR